MYRFFIHISLILGPYSLCGQGPLRSATEAVLRELGLADAEALTGQLRRVNADFRAAAAEEKDDPALYFSLLYHSYYGRAGEGFSLVRAILEQQEVPAAAGSRCQPFPFLAQTVLLIAKERNDFTWLQAAPPGSEHTYYERLRQYLGCWLDFQDSDGNGLPETEGDTLFFAQAGSAGKLESVALACYLYRECKAMIRLAHQLRRPADQDVYRQRASIMADALNDLLWDEAKGFYYDREATTGQLLPFRSVAGFLPLFAGMASYQQAERLVREHLSNPSEFWMPCPLPLRLDDDAEPAVWIPANYMVFQGLMDYGYRELARELARETFALVFPGELPMRRYFNPVTGRGYGPPALGSWAGLAFLMPWEYELNYSPSTLSWQPLVRLAPQYLGLNWGQE